MQCNSLEGTDFTKNNKVSNVHAFFSLCKAAENKSNWGNEPLNIQLSEILFRIFDKKVIEKKSLVSNHLGLLRKLVSIQFQCHKKMCLK